MPHQFVRDDSLKADELVFSNRESVDASSVEVEGTVGKLVTGDAGLPCIAAESSALNCFWSV